MNDTASAHQATGVETSAPTIEGVGDSQTATLAHIGLPADHGIGAVQTGLALVVSLAPALALWHDGVNEGYRALVTAEIDTTRAAAGFANSDAGIGVIQMELAA